MAAGRMAEIRLAALAPLVAEVETAGLDWLSDDERTRWSAMGSEIRRRQFLAGHWLIRSLAADALGGEPAQWVLSAGADGAPALRSPACDAGQGVAASLSHSAEWVVAAVASFPVGIDLEHPSRPRNLRALADYAFSPEECAELRGLPDDERTAAFYLFWTIKEAVGKREGHGLRPELARRQRPISCAADAADVVSWQFADCSLALAGEPGMPVRVTGIPETARRCYWRIESVAA